MRPVCFIVLLRSTAGGWGGPRGSREEAGGMGWGWTSTKMKRSGGEEDPGFRSSGLEVIRDRPLLRSSVLFSPLRSTPKRPYPSTIRIKYRIPWKRIPLTIYNYTGTRQATSRVGTVGRRSGSWSKCRSRCRSSGSPGRFRENHKKSEKSGFLCVEARVQCSEKKHQWTEIFFISNCNKGRCKLRDWEVHITFFSINKGFKNKHLIQTPISYCDC